MENEQKSTSTQLSDIIKNQTSLQAIEDIQNNEGNTVFHIIATLGSELACVQLLKYFQEPKFITTFLLVMKKYNMKLPKPLFSYIVNLIYPDLVLYSETPHYKQDLERILSIKNKKNLTAYTLTLKQRTG